MITALNVNGASAARLPTLKGAKEQFESLLEWAKSHGAVLSKKVGHEVSCYGGEPSVQYVAKETIKKGDLILQVPKKIQFQLKESDDSVWKIMEEKTSETFLENMKRQPQVVMAIKLLMEEKSAEVSPQLSFFPTKPPSVVYYDNKTLERSTHKTLMKHVLQRKLVLTSIWSMIKLELVPHLPPNTIDNFTMKNFLRAWIIISSRSHGHFSNPAKATKADTVGRQKLDWKKKFFSVVPLADLMNHDSSVCDHTLENLNSLNGSDILEKSLLISNSMSHYKYDPVTLAFEVTAARTFKTGEPIVICYGNIASVNLLLNYGFAQTANQFDALRVDAVFENVHAEKQKRVINLLKLPQSYNLQGTTIKLSRHFLIAARIGQMPGANVDVLEYLVKKMMKTMTADEVRAHDDVTTMLEKVPTSMVYASLLAQSIIFERYGSSKNDDAEIEMLRKDVEDVEACSTSPEQAERRLGARRAHATLASLTLKKSRALLGKKIGDLMLDMYLKSLLKEGMLKGYRASDIAKFNMTDIKERVFHSVYMHFGAKESKLQQFTTTDGILEIFSVGRRVHRTDATEERSNRETISSQGRESSPAGQEAYQVVQNFDGTFTSIRDGKIQTFRSYQEAVQDKGVFKKISPHIPKQVTRNFDGTLTAVWDGHVRTFRSQTELDIFFSSATGHQTAQPFNMPTNGNSWKQQLQKLSLGLQEHNPIKKSTGKARPNDRKATAKKHHRSRGTEDTFKMPSKDQVAMVEAIKAAMKNIKFGDGNQDVSESEMEKISQFLRNDEFIDKFASKMIQGVINGMNSIVESKVFEFVEDTYTRPMNFGD